MVKQHGLDPESNIVGTAHVALDVDQFCGISLGIKGARKNGPRPIEIGVNWNEYGAS